MINTKGLSIGSSIFCFIGMNNLWRIGGKESILGGSFLGLLAILNMFFAFQEIDGE